MTKSDEVTAAVATPQPPHPEGVHPLVADPERRGEDRQRQSQQGATDGLVGPGDAAGAFRHGVR
jgi:hypothetical protein